MKKKRNKIIEKNAVTGDNKPVAAFFMVIKSVVGGQKQLLSVLSAILQNI